MTRLVFESLFSNIGGKQNFLKIHPLFQCNILPKSPTLLNQHLVYARDV